MCTGYSSRLCTILYRKNTQQFNQPLNFSFRQAEPAAGNRPAPLVGGLEGSPLVVPQPSAARPSTIHSSSLNHPQLFPQPSTALPSTIHSSSLNHSQLFTQPSAARPTGIPIVARFHPSLPFFLSTCSRYFLYPNHAYYCTCLCSLFPHNIPQIPFYLLSLPVYVYQSSFSVSATCLHAIPVSTACPHYLSTRLE